MRLLSPIVTATVREATEELWKCQSLEQATKWLQVLYQALLRDELDTYDPSETFLAVQGAALRFGGERGESAAGSVHPTTTTATTTPTPTENNRTGVHLYGQRDSDSSHPVVSDSNQVLSSSNNNDNNKDSVWEEAIWCAAALARVCVGPAWHAQNRTRRQELQAQLHHQGDDVSHRSNNRQQQQQQQQQSSLLPSSSFQNTNSGNEA